MSQEKIRKSKGTMEAPAKSSKTSHPSLTGMIGVGDPEKRLKKTTFRTDLQDSGIRGGIIRSLVALYEEEPKPDNPLAYISGHLGTGLPLKPQLRALQKGIVEIRGRIQAMKAENEHLRQILENVGLVYGPGGDGLNGQGRGSYLTKDGLEGEEEEEDGHGQGKEDDGQGQGDGGRAKDESDDSDNWEAPPVSNKPRFPLRRNYD